MKYSLFTVGVPEMTPEEALKKMQEYGYDGVDWRVTALPTDPEILAEAPSYWKNNLCTYEIDQIDELAPQIKELSAKYGMEINALATYLDCSDPDEKIAKAMEGAKRMGCSRIRVNCIKYDPEKGYRKLFEEAVEGFGRVEKLAKKYGVKADFEMHMGTITPSASAAYRLASHFDPQYIGVIYDTGNTIYEGLEEYQMAFEILGEYMDLVHIKNAQWIKKDVDGVEKYKPDWAPFTDGYADFERVFKALKAVGYDSYLTFEDFSNEQTSDEKLKNDLAYIKKLVEEVYGE